MDWKTATYMLVIVVFSTVMGADSIWAVFVGKRFDFHPSWQTLFPIMVLGAAVILLPDRITRFVLGLLLFRPLIEIIGWLLHFSPEAQGMNQLIGGCTNVAACLIAFIYGVYWFKERITYA